jgi:hypothetical protein
MTTEAKVKKPLKIKCPDCKRSYQAGAPHNAFCPVKTCSECGTSFGYVIPVYDSRVKPPIRLCDTCLNERLDAEEGENDDD